jgi:16S rRNA (uracil1498-N3)-methyltransferase
MNLFYAHPDNIRGDRLELTGQEAHHAARVLRYRPGDSIEVTDGRGYRYTGTVNRINDNTVSVIVDQKIYKEPPSPECWLGMGILKKRSRLEFAVEKAVELGAQRISLFKSDHTVKENVRMDRLEATALSAMKQSLRNWLPQISLFDSLEDLLEAQTEAQLLMAHEKKKEEGDGALVSLPVGSAGSANTLLLLVGPEGGFSPREVQKVQRRNGRLVSLGRYRLRTETAAVVFLSRFLEIG